MDYRLPGSSIHGILQAIILEWVLMPASRGGLLDLGIKLMCLYLFLWQVGSWPLAPPGKVTTDGRMEIGTEVTIKHSILAFSLDVEKNYYTFSSLPLIQNYSLWGKWCLFVIKNIQKTGQEAHIGYWGIPRGDDHHCSFWFMSKCPQVEGNDDHLIYGVQG